MDTSEHIDILVYAAVFLHEAYPRLNDLLRERAAEGCSVRIALGDAESENVRQRGEEERFGHGIESRCRLALMHYRPLVGVPGIEIRTHAKTLYNSQRCRRDLRHLRPELDAVWATALPVQEE